MSLPTARQLQVLRIRATGASQDAVAHELGIARNTVKNLQTGAFQRLGVSGILEAFVALGWLRVPGSNPAVVASDPAAVTPAPSP